MTLVSEYQPVVEIYHLSDISTVPALLAAVGEETCNRWVAIGSTDSKVHWAYGRECDALISEGAKAGLVYKAIALKAGRDSQTIRKAYYTFKDFTDTERELYHMVPYSVFQQARTQDDKIAVLEHYKVSKSVDEIITVFPEIENKEFDAYFKTTGLSRIFYGIQRELFGIDPIWKREADEHIKALDEIIKHANGEK